MTWPTNRYLVRILESTPLSTPSKPSKLAFEGFEGPAQGRISENDSSPYTATMVALRAFCPAFVEEARWQQAIADADTFLARWAAQSEALGWTARELFGLHQPPEKPHASYDRLGRYDCTGLVWLLDGRPVVALTAETAAIQTRSGGILTYRKERKPALGPVGDSLDDFDGVA